MKRRTALIGLLAMSACNTLPSVGPSRKEIVNGTDAAGRKSNIIPVTHGIAAATRVSSGYGFPSSFYGAGIPNYEGIKAGDILQITVWENVDNGLFATLGSRVTQLSPMRVSEAGSIFVPYVGNIKTHGRTTDQLRQEITAKLSGQTPDPQVEVTMVTSSTKGGVTIFSTGTTGGGGTLVPFNEGNLSLAPMLAGAGGISGDPQSTRLTLTRDGQTGTILVQSLYDNPKNDIALRNNDRIVIESDRRYYRMLGSGGSQNLVAFTREDLSILDAISENGGLNSSVSDPSGIFVFRTVSANVANRLYGSNRFSGSVNLVFTIDLRGSDGLFLADEFQLQDRDTVYITEAPFVTWTKVIGAVSSTVSSVSSLATTTNTLTN